MSAWGVAWGGSWGIAWGAISGPQLGAGMDIRPTLPDPRAIRRAQDDRDIAEILTAIMATGLIDES